MLSPATLSTAVLPLVVASVAAAGLAAGCGGSGRGGEELFSYDRSAPLHFTDNGRVNHDYPIAVRDVSFTLVHGRRIEGLLAVPPGKGPFPAVVLAHGSGGDRTQLLVAATWLAARGMIALTISDPALPVDTAAGAETQLRQQRDASVASVESVRRAVDALQALPAVDDDHIGFMGWSAGGRTGAMVAGLDDRIHAFDLLSAGSTPVADYASEAPESLRPAVERELGAVDPLRLVAAARDGSILLQDGRRDTVVPRSALDALARAAGKAAEVRWYDQGHEPSRKAYADGLDWLAGKLGARGPAVKGADAGP